MGLKDPRRTLRELGPCSPASAGTAASAVGERPGRGWQEAEARLNAQGAAPQVAGLAACDWG